MNFFQQKLFLLPEINLLYCKFTPWFAAFIQPKYSIPKSVQE